MSRDWIRVALVAAVVALAIGTWTQRTQTASKPAAGSHSSRPVQIESYAGQRFSTFCDAVATLAEIVAGGPFRYARDGTEFMNRELRLPRRPRGYYREYTVDTPGASDRGARRIVAGGDPPEVYYYTDDHYGTFRRVEAADGG
jgi:guanyl-specific ribonuclease Sa